MPQDNNQEANEHGVRRISPATSSPVTIGDSAAGGNESVRRLAQRVLELFQAKIQLQTNFNSLRSHMMHSERMATEVCSRAVARIDEQEQRLIAQDTNLLELTGLCETLLERLELCEVQLSRMNYYLPGPEMYVGLNEERGKLSSKIKSIFGDRGR